MCLGIVLLGLLAGFVGSGTHLISRILIFWGVGLRYGFPMVVAGVGCAVLQSTLGYIDLSQRYTDSAILN